MKKLSVALIGYGKMGKIIESICFERGHSIHCIIDKADDFITQKQAFSTCDVAIDFSLPEAVTDNIHNQHDANLNSALKCDFLNY